MCLYRRPCEDEHLRPDGGRRQCSAGVSAGPADEEVWHRMGDRDRGRAHSASASARGAGGPPPGPAGLGFGARPPKRPRTSAEIRDTFRSVLLIGLAVHGAGVLGSLLATGLALRSPVNELPIGEEVVFPLLFIVIVLAIYVCFFAVHSVVLVFMRHGRFRPALTVMSIAGFVLVAALFFAGFLLFGERFLLLGAAAAYAVPYFLAPLVVGVPTTAAAAVLSVRKVREIAQTAKPRRAAPPARLLR